MVVTSIRVNWEAVGGGGGGGGGGGVSCAQGDVVSFLRDDAGLGTATDSRDPH